MVSDQSCIWYLDPLAFSRYAEVQAFSATAATFGVNCDMPGLHFEDTCVSDEDCVDFPQTVCQAMPVNLGLDPGTRELPFQDWKKVTM